MASVIDTPCPSCGNRFKVPDSVLGKKIKCKQCGHTFVVRDPAEDEDDRPVKKIAVKPSKPGGTTTKIEKAEAKKPEPKPADPQPAVTYKFEDDEEDGAKPKPLAVVDEGLEIPRCPFCAMELDPPDAKVCVHCGFNNVTRVRAESKKVWEPDINDWFTHLGPGILALIVVIAIVVIVIICSLNMRSWMIDSIFMKDDLGPDGEKAFLVKPGAFITFVIFALVMPFLKCGRFAIKRLLIEYKPTERVKT